MRSEREEEEEESRGSSERGGRGVRPQGGSQIG
jgi:hypothetical protein